jgi:dTDP-4-amino-4,6-dideoxygalactose transaminase
MEAIREIAGKHNLYVLEDLSEGHGIQPIGDIAIYSFQATKIIHSEEGGMLITNNDKWAEEINLRKTLANKGDYFHPIMGFNYRMANSQAQLALDSFHSLAWSLKNRRNKEAELDKIYGKGKYRDVVWVYDIICGSEQERDEKLKTIPNSRPFFKPLSSMPMYNQKVGEKALYYSQRGLVIKL